MTQRVVQATASMTQTPLPSSTSTSAGTGPVNGPSRANMGFAANVSPTTVNFNNNAVALETPTAAIK